MYLEEGGQAHTLEVAALQQSRYQQARIETSQHHTEYPQYIHGPSPQV